MANFFANIKMTLTDAASAPLQKMRGNLTGIADATKKINNGDNLVAMSSQFAMATAMIAPFQQTLSATLDYCSTATSGLENSLAAVNSVLNKNNSIGGDTAKTYDFMKKASLDWASGTTKGSNLATTSAAEFAKTSYSMVSAGLDASAAVEATQQSLILAKATMGENGAAADLLATLYNNMADKTKPMQSEMQRLGDIVASTQGAFQIANLGQLNEGLKYGVPVAQKYGVALAETSSIIGQLNTSGLTGSMAGTAFGSMMAQMQKANNKLDFGIHYYEDGGMNVMGTLDEIVAKFGDVKSWTPEITASIDEAFGQEGSRALVLLASNLDSLKGNLDLVTNSEGQAAMMASKMSDTYSDKMMRLKNAQEAIAASMGQQSNRMKGFLAGIGTGILEAFNPFLTGTIGSSLAMTGTGLSWISSAGMGFMQSASQIMMFASLVSKAGGFIGLFKNTVGLAGNAVRLLGTPFIATGKLVGKIGIGFIKGIPAAISWMSTMWGVAAAHIAACWPIYAIIAAVALLSLGTIVLVKNWGKVTGFFGKLWTGIKRGFINFKNFVWSIFDNKLIQGIMVAFMPFIGIPIAIIKNWAVIKSFFFTLFQGLKNGFIEFITNPFEFLLSVPQKIVSLWQPVKNFFASIFGGDAKSANQGAPFGDVPHYAKGTDYVPQTGLAFIHKGEKIIPAEFNAKKQKTGENYSTQNTHGVCNITNYITLNCEDIRRMEDFISMLQLAGGCPV